MPGLCRGRSTHRPLLKCSTTLPSKDIPVVAVNPLVVQWSADRPRSSQGLGGRLPRYHLVYERRRASFLTGTLADLSGPKPRPTFRSWRGEKSYGRQGWRRPIPALASRAAAGGRRHRGRGGEPFGQRGGRRRAFAARSQCKRLRALAVYPPPARYGRRSVPRRDIKDSRKLIVGPIPVPCLPGGRIFKPDSPTIQAHRARAPLDVKG